MNGGNFSLLKNQFLIDEGSFFFFSFLTETFLCIIFYLNIISLQCLFSILINIILFFKF